MKVPDPPGSWKDTAEGKGVRREVEEVGIYYKFMGCSITNGTLLQAFRVGNGTRIDLLVQLCKPGYAEIPTPYAESLL